MSNKTLLNEAQVRKFMKLASLQPLAAGFVEGLSGRTYDEMEESHGSGKSELNRPDDGLGRHTNRAGIMSEEEELEDMAVDAEEDAGDMEQDVEDLAVVAADDAPSVDRMISVDDFLSALEGALEGVMGDEVEIDSSEMADEEEAVEDEEVADMDMGAADMEADDMEMDDEMLEEEEGSKKGEYKRRDKDGKVGKKAGDVDGHYKDDEVSESVTDELVEQITKRVAARILKSALATK